MIVVRRLAAMIALCVLCAGTVVLGGQPKPTVTVVTAAPAFLLPDETRQPLSTIKVGSVLTVIEVEGDWFNVEFQDPAYGRRVGYVHRTYVKADVPKTRRPEPVAPPVTVVTAAPVFLLPDETRQPLSTIKAGSTLAVIEVEGDWFHVEFQDRAYGRRVGYVHRKYLKVDVPETRRPEPVAPPQPPAAPAPPVDVQPRPADPTTGAGTAGRRPTRWRHSDGS